MAVVQQEMFTRPGFAKFCEEEASRAEERADQYSQLGKWAKASDCMARAARYRARASRP